MVKTLVNIRRAEHLPEEDGRKGGGWKEGGSEGNGEEQREVRRDRGCKKGEQSER